MFESDLFSLDKTINNHHQQSKYIFKNIFFVNGSFS